jgi:hypothetical protein
VPTAPETDPSGDLRCGYDQESVNNWQYHFDSFKMPVYWVESMICAGTVEFVHDKHDVHPMDVDRQGFTNPIPNLTNIGEIC